MAPKNPQKVAPSTSAKSSKAAATPLKSSTSTSIHHGISKRQPKSDRSASRTNQDFGHASVAIAGTSKKSIEPKKSTSIVARRRQRPKMNLREIMAESVRKDDSPKDYSTTFAAGSTALFTWGKAASQPVQAVGSLRRHKRFKLFGVGRGRNSGFAKLTFGVNHDGRAIIPFRFLDLPLEIRWKVYGFLLIHPRPVLVYPDWQTVHVNSPQNHTILRTNKQIFLESSQFLYEKNVFYAVINSKPLAIGPEFNPTTRHIQSQFLLFLKNVILECQFNTYAKGAANKLGATARCLKILVRSGACLDSVTLTVSSTAYVQRVNIAPQPGAMPVTFLQVQRPPVLMTIPEFFKVPDSEIMRVIPKLHCKVLNLVLRIPHAERVVVSINLRDLPANQDKDGWFAEEKTARRSARHRTQIVRADLMGLQKRLEDIFENCDRAIMEGKARPLREDERVTDGLRLANPARGRNT